MRVTGSGFDVPVFEHFLNEFHIAGFAKGLCPNVMTDVVVLKAQIDNSGQISRFAIACPEF
ncbi:hypothetical protein X772_32945 [Mesorhizobium sp. LSJC280B00]|nr:hypothetical protein X772_32945 [Mesorhizobium sp. LSJC280B00]